MRKRLHRSNSKGHLYPVYLNHDEPKMHIYTVALYHRIKTFLPYIMESQGVPDVDTG